MWVEQFVVNAFFDELWEVLRIVLSHVSVQNFFAQHFFGDGVHQQTCGGVGVVGVFFNQGASGQDRGFVNLIHRNAVVEVTHGLGHDGLRTHIRAQTGASVIDQTLQVLQVQRYALTAFEHMHSGGCGRGLFFGVGALLGAAFAVEHVGTGNFVVATAHQTELDLVLYVFDVESTATWT